MSKVKKVKVAPVLFTAEVSPKMAKMLARDAKIDGFEVDEYFQMIVDKVLKNAEDQKKAQKKAQKKTQTEKHQDEVISEPIIEEEVKPNLFKRIWNRLGN